MLPTELAETQGMETMPLVLVVEDDEAMRNLIGEVLEPLSARIILSKNARDAMDILSRQHVAVVLTDLRMPYADGIDILNHAKQQNPLTQVVLITGHATIETAIDALKSGAYDYLRKPFEPAELRQAIENVLNFYVLNRENLQLREFRKQSGADDLVGKSTAMENVRRLISTAALYDCSVLITGESGTGKEVVSRRIHAQSPRTEKPFVAINCAAVPDSLIESELFGYQRGAFTGADSSRIGLFEAANGGTLFLDEINNASLSLQAKLLRVLQDGIFYRVGDHKPRQLDVRMLVATNRPLRELIDKETFRKDLYYRLKIIEINLPPLRERSNDIPVLANYFIEKQSARLKKSVKGISTKALNLLLRHDWPGNARELENAIQRMIIFAESEVLDVDSVPPEFLEARDLRAGSNVLESPQSLEEMEIAFITKVLQENNGNRAVSADILGIDKTTLWRKIKQYNIAC